MSEVELFVLVRGRGRNASFSPSKGRRCEAIPSHGDGKISPEMMVHITNLFAGAESFPTLGEAIGGTVKFKCLFYTNLEPASPSSPRA